MDATTYELTLEGFSALVMNSNAALLTGGEDKGRDPAQYERDHYLDKCYRNTTGSLVIPARAIKKAMIDACRFLPEKPKGTNFKSYGPFIQAAMIITSDLVLNVTEDRVFPLTLVVNLDPSKGNKGPRGPRTRPCIAPPWGGRCEAVVVDPILKLDVLERLAERAGKQVGFLDGRAIDFGRAYVTVRPAKG